MSFRVYYRAWNTDLNQPAIGDATNHTIFVEIEGTGQVGVMVGDEIELGDGLYQISSLIDPIFPAGARFAVYGASSTPDVVIIGETGVRPEPMRGTDGAAAPGDEMDVTAEAAAGIATAARSELERSGGMLDNLKAKFAGMTSLPNWLRTAWTNVKNAAALSEINTGGRTFDESVHSQQAAASVGGTVVLPVGSVLRDRVKRHSLSVFQGETVTVSITVYEADETTPCDLSGKTLRLVLDDAEKNELATVEADAITIGGDGNNVATFAVPTAASEAEGRVAYALRDATAPKTVYAQGIMTVNYAPNSAA